MTTETVAVAHYQCEVEKDSGFDAPPGGYVLLVYGALEIPRYVPCHNWVNYVRHGMDRRVSEYRKAVIIITKLK